MTVPAGYLDECVDHNLVAALRQRGFIVSSALEQNRANISEEDAAQLAYAAAEGWVLITHNERHFRALSDQHRQRHEPHGGIIVLPERPPFSRLVVRASMMLDWLGTMPQYRSELFKWGHLQALLSKVSAFRVTVRATFGKRLRDSAGIVANCARRR